MEDAFLSREAGYMQAICANTGRFGKNVFKLNVAAS
jgi:hypothetical protein